jgi:hypothetical protein
MKEKPKTLTLETFLKDMLKTGVDTTIQYLYDNREAISNTLTEKLQEIVAKQEEGEEEDHREVHRVEVKDANEEEN